MIIAELFMEIGGGRVISKMTGHDVVEVNVKGLTTDESLRVMRCIMAALDDEFRRSDDE